MESKKRASTLGYTLIVSRTTPDRAKVASGVFDTLKEFLSEHPEEAATPDLHESRLTFLSSLMLAQGQEMFYVLASIHLKMKPTSLSKLYDRKSY